MVIESSMATKRFEALVDGIFGVAMTLLVLSIAVPIITGPVSNLTLIQSLFALLPQFIVYAFAFILTAVFWYHHHEFLSILKRADIVFFWINIFWLMLIVLVPFSAALTSDYGEFEVAAIFFHLNMFVIGLLFSLAFTYAIKRDFIDRKDLARALALRKNSFSLPITALIALLLAAFVAPQLSYFAYLLNFFVDRVLEKI